MLQKIVLYLSDPGAAASLIEQGIRLAAIFNKEICLFYHARKKEHGLEIDGQLVRYRETIHVRFPDLPVSLLVGSYRKDRMARILADEQEAVLVLAESHDFRTLSAALLESPIPFLFISASVTSRSSYRKIVFPVDLRLRNSEAMKWILYFGKFNHSEIIVIGANDRDSSNRRQVHQNLAILKKMLLKYDIAHRFVKGTRNSLGIYRESLYAAREIQADMLVLLGSPVLTLPDLLLGQPEAKMVREAGDLPVLIVNPRREAYLVCE